MIDIYNIRIYLLLLNTYMYCSTTALYCTVILIIQTVSARYCYFLVWDEFIARPHDYTINTTGPGATLMSTAVAAAGRVASTRDPG